MRRAEPVVLCVGDMDVDEVIAVTRLPEPGGKVDGRLIGRFPGGMATNTAVALARLGVTARLVAAIGEDAAGEMARSAVAAAGVDLSALVVVPNAATFTSLVLIDGAGEKALVRLPSAAYLPATGDLSAIAFSGADHVHVTLGDAALTRAVMEHAAQVGAGTSLDVEAPDIASAGNAIGGIIKMASLVFANEAALAALGDAVGRAAVAAIPELVLTRGSAGASIHIDGRVHAVPGHSVKVVDTTGAGDCFAAAYIAERLRGAGPPQAGRFAAAAAALSVTGYGAQTTMPTREAVERVLAANPA